MARAYRKLTDQLIDAVSDFAEGEVKLLWDTDVRGLQCRVGKKRITFAFFQEHSVRGKRSTSYERLGFRPAMKVRDARKAALQVAGRIAAGYLRPGKREATTVAAAIAEYVRYAKAKAEGERKRPTWAKQAERLAAKYILPAFGTWSLAELAKAPLVVRDWHSKIKKLVTANRCASILSAAYNRAADIDRSLPRCESVLRGHL